MQPPSGSSRALCAKLSSPQAVYWPKKQREMRVCLCVCLCVCVHTSVQGSIQNCALSTPSTGKDPTPSHRGGQGPRVRPAEALT